MSTCDNHPEPFIVIDAGSGRYASFDPRGLECWIAETEHGDWDGHLEVFQTIRDESLYRHASGAWTLITEWEHWEAEVAATPQARRLDDNEAVQWLLRHNFPPPAALASLADEHIFQPGPPREGEVDRTGQNFRSNPAQAKEPEERDPWDEELRDVPEWDKDMGELRWRGKVIRRVTIGRAQNVVTVLDAFQQQDWKQRIGDPLSRSVNPCRLNDTVRSLNVGLTGIIFESDGTNTGIRWRPR